MNENIQNKERLVPILYIVGGKRGGETKER
jgi:hypothetical protein